MAHRLNLQSGSSTLITKIAKIAKIFEIADIDSLSVADRAEVDGASDADVSSAVQLQADAADVVHRCTGLVLQFDGHRLLVDRRVL